MLLSILISHHQPRWQNRSFPFSHVKFRLESYKLELSLKKIESFEWKTSKKAAGFYLTTILLIILKRDEQP